jgi:hypothetical protein
LVSVPSDRNTTTEANNSAIITHHSPYTNRKSRQKEKIEKEKESGSTAQTNRDREMIADQVDIYDNSRLLGKLK